jgi:enoyl-CoA hydratase/carnithine racemase
MKDFDTIRCEVRDGIATVALARPDKHNAMNLAMFGELAEAADLVAINDDVRVVLVRGDGPSFCAGIDVGDLAGMAGATADDVRSLATRAQRPFLAIAAMEKPSVAIVHGHALGAGFQLAAACDLRVATEDASFRVLEIRFGLVPDLGGPMRLVQLVGPARATELIWTGRRITGLEALSMGLVNRVAPPDQLESDAAELVGAIAAAPQLTVRLGGRLVDTSPNQSLEDHLAQARESQVACVATEDQREAVAAFLERREPRFRGR